MSRPSWDQTFMTIARTWAERATCLRGAYGAVFANDDHQVLASGYNGAPRNLPHCGQMKWTWHNGREHDNGEIYGCLMEDNHCVRTVHAEVNGIIQAARTGVSLLRSRLYVTGRPCQRCALAIVQVGVVEAIWPEEQTYHTDSEDMVLKTFDAAGIQVRLL